MTNQELTDIYFRLYDTLPEEVAERAKENFDITRAMVLPVPAELVDALHSGFAWSGTPEKYAYWKCLYLDRLEATTVNNDRRELFIKLYSELPSPIKELAIKNYDPEYSTKMPLDIADAIKDGFSWIGSPEDSDFWLDVYTAVVKNKSLHRIVFDLEANKALSMEPGPEREKVFKNLLKRFLDEKL